MPFEDLPNECYKNIMKWLFSLRFRLLRIEIPSYLRKSSVKELQSLWSNISLDNRLSQEKLKALSSNKRLTIKDEENSRGNSETNHIKSPDKTNLREGVMLRRANPIEVNPPINSSVSPMKRVHTQENRENHI